MKRALGFAMVSFVLTVGLFTLARPSTVLSDPGGKASGGEASGAVRTGGFLLVWRSNVSDRHFPLGTLVAQRYLPDGTQNGAEFAAELDSSYVVAWAAPDGSFSVVQRAAEAAPLTRDALAKAFVGNVFAASSAPDLNGDGRSDAGDVFALLNQQFRSEPVAPVRGFAAVDAATDVFTAATVTAPGTGIVEVPIYVRDNPGTPIGTDQPSGKKITNIAFQIVYGPIGCVTTVSPFVDVSSGVLSGPRTFFYAPFVQGTSQSMVFTRIESAGLIPFTGGDDEIGKIVFSLNSCAPGTVIPLTFTSSLTALGSQDNTNESVANGTLSLVNGSITVGEGGEPTPTPTPTATPTVTPTATPTATPTPTPCITGDVNGDGTVDAADVTYLRNFVLGRGPAPVCSGDLNGDGNVDELDVEVLQHLVRGRGSK